MHHPDLRLPTAIAAGIVRGKDLMVDKIAKSGGGTVRNQEWDTPLRDWEVPFPTMQRTSADFVAIEELWDAVNGNTDTFAFFDEVAGEDVRVRFEGQLRQVHVAGPWWSFETLMLVEEPE